MNKKFQRGRDHGVASYLTVRQDQVKNILKFIKYTIILLALDSYIEKISLFFKSKTEAYF